MISDILKAIELLVEILKSGKSPEAKRSKFGKTLLQIYQHLVIVIDRGYTILSSMKMEHVGIYVVTVPLLEEQYRSLQFLIDMLNEAHINAILHLHLPSLKEVNALLDVKVDTISILLATLYEGQEVATKAENEIDMLRLDSGLVPVNKLLSFSQDEPLGLMLQKALAEQEEFCVILATPEHLTGSREILQRLSKMAEILRAFIVENFTLEDLL